MQRRHAYLPLHGGKTPAWLFQRMTRLAGAMTMAVVEEYGPGEMLRRLADPWWFQAFGCVLGFDWHSSGVTTVTCGALKEAQKRLGQDLGIIVAGGKGATSRRTLAEIADFSSRYAISNGDNLVYASRMSAKVDSAAVQDGYALYHHSFFFTQNGAWCVVQQGMNDAKGKARRYHWLGETLENFVCEPHSAVRDLENTPLNGEIQLNMVALEAEKSRYTSAELVRENPEAILRLIEKQQDGSTLFAPHHHPVLAEDVNYERLKKVVQVAHEKHPHDFQTLLGTAQVGAATIRSLALIAELLYGIPLSKKDPALISPGRKWADYSFAHGGKDGHPFPVDRSTYDRNISVLEEALRKAKTGFSEKKEALKRLAALDRQELLEPGVPL